MDNEWSKLQQLIKQEEKKEADAGALSKASKMLREAIKYCRENGLEAIAAVAIIDIVDLGSAMQVLPHQHPPCTS
jgi:hypothetical protein